MKKELSPSFWEGGTRLASGEGKTENLADSWMKSRDNDRTLPAYATLPKGG